MSTRAMYTFYDTIDTIKDACHVYKHHDGYPSGAAQWIEAALPYAWKGGRFEADEFAAAFVAGNKSPYINEELAILRELEAWLSANADDTSLLTQFNERLAACRGYASNGGGGVRLMHSGSVYAVAPADIEYRYEITSRKGELHVACYATHFWETQTKANEKLEFKGTLEAFKAWAQLEREAA